MIMYTIVAEDTLYAGFEHIQATEEMQIEGVLMEVEILTNREVKIVRIISPELAPYLNDAYMPGRIVHL